VTLPFDDEIKANLELAIRSLEAARHDTVWLPGGADMSAMAVRRNFINGAKIVIY